MVASGSLAGEECGGEVEVKRRMTHLEEEDICISGIAGDFPDSDGVQELGEHLFNKVDLISDDDRRWKLDHPEIPQRTGKLKTVNKFDAASFGIHYNQAQAMDPMLRILLEKSYEAIVDSGNNPYSMRGSKTGVFIGACFSESEKTWFYEKLQVDGFGITGCIRTMLANRISYAFGLDGPSYVVDTACSSSMYALEQGYNAIREGHCEAAIVGGCNLCLHPYVSLQFARLGVLSFDGRCKVFDEAANGYCRSEAIAVCFLQKKKNSKRIYATLVHAKTNCDGYKEQGITYPSGEMQQRLLEEFYEECGINPSTLAWIEAHGTGTKVGDPEEVRALYNVFCKDRTTPLKIGSVKSNLGHTEPTSGMCSIAKVIIAMENLKIPPNINFKTPRSDIEYFHTGEIEVVTEPTPWDGGLVGVNSFGFGGANCHALLKWNEKTKVNGGLPEDDLPRLVNVSGRTEEAVDTLLKHMEMNILDKEFVRLIHSIYKDEVPSHLYRGYSILTKNKSVNLRDIQYFGMRQPLYVQFSGHCNKWKSFDKGLLQFPVFKQSLAKLSNVISHDLVNLVTNPTNIMSDPVEFIVAVVASQIALYNLLKHIGVEADGYIGISFGNLAVAYADGVLSAEDAIGIAYNLANILVESSNRAGGVFEKNHQGGETKRLSQKLLSSCKPKIIDVLKKTIKNGVSPSSKWLRNGAEKDSGAEFFYQSIVSTMNLKVDDEELPEEFILLNVGPKGSYDHMPEMETRELLDNSEGGDDVTAFLVGVGKLYQGGIESDLAKLYPEVEYPVSRATPMIAPLVRWNHTDDWFVTSYKLQKKIGAGERTISISLTEDESEYISGHVVDGRNLFPATGYLSLVWETVGLIKGEHYTEVPIVFEDVRFLRATNMSKDGSVDFTVIVQRASGNFEVVEGGAPIVTGRAYVPDDIDAEMSLFDAPIHCDKEMPMKTKDIYKELRLRGYNYKGLFRSMMGANPNENVGVVRWQKNWVAFMDNMLQMQILQVDTRGLFVPTSIDKVVIDGRKHVQAILSFPEEEDKDLAVYYFKEAGLIKSGGIEIRGPRANAISRKKNLAEAILEKYLFVPNNTESEIFNLEEIVRVYAQIILENENSINVKACELYDKDHTMLAPLVALVLSELPLIQPEILVLGTPVIPEDDPLPPEVKVEDKKLNTDQTLLMVAGNNILHPSQSEVFESCLNAIKPGGYIVAREKLDVEFQSNKVTILCSHVFNNERVMLLRKMAPVENIPTEVFHAAQNEFSWIPPSQTALKSKEVKRVIFYNLDGKNSGTLGFVNCVRKEPDGQKARCVLSMDTNVPQFEINHPFYKSQLSLDLAVNVYENGQWGTYRHLKMDAANKVKSYHIYANNLVRGDLSSLSWIKGTIPNESCVNPGEQDICYNCYSALNFRDIMLASGKLAPETIIKQRALQECVIGFEFSGYSSDGRRIMGMITSAGLASIVAYDRHLSWEIPDEWTLEEAATVPVTYGTALFALVMRGKMKKGDSVLIHAGTGGVGQAAINLAVAMGCEVFTTVGTPEKRQFIKDTWPQIDDRHIGNSRDTSFEQMVMHETNGRGVDLVLNSLAEEKLLASVRCLAKGGRFLEIGKFDLANNNPLGMEIFAKGGSFHGILLDTFFDAEPQAKSIIREILKEYIEKGLVKPLCSKVFKHEEIENAFRFMASGKHIGKVLIHMRDESDVRDPSKLIPFDAIPRFYCKLDYTYIVIGGLGGFGLELADWLVMRGCNRLVLTSRKGVSNGYQSYRIGLWRSYGVQVEVLTDDITTYEGVEQVLLKSEAMGPVGGIFNLAVVLKDAIYENQNEESFLTSLGPKAVATKHLDELSRKLCPQLDQFVVFSSVSCGRGNGGQTNYGMANSVMERICEKRAADGLPGIAIQWGAVGDVGLVAEMMEDHVEIVIGGTLQQRISSCLEVMDQFLNQNHPIVASMVVAEKKSGRSSSGNIVDTVVNILGIRDLKTVSFHSNLAELGMDSMMAVEIKQTLEREFEVFLSPQDIRGMTIAKLQEIAAAREAPQEDKAAPDGEIQSNPLAVDDYLIQVIAPEPEKYEPVTKMETLASNSTEKKTRLIVVPGLEGFPIVFEKMVKKMDLEVYGVTMDYRSTTQQISEVVDSLLPAVLSHLEDKTFNIFGYSYGGLISMELVRRLELQGYSGKLIILDSSPEMMQQYSKSIFADKIDDNLQVQTLLRILHNSLRVTVKPEVEDLLREAPDWDGRVEMITSIAKNAAPFSETYMKQLFNSGYGRVLSIFNLQEFPEKCISSPVTLIRPTELVCQISEDYGLSKYCVQPVPVHFVEGNHFTAVSNPKTREIVTETLTGGTLISSKAPAVSPPTEIQVVRDTEKQI